MKYDKALDLYMRGFNNEYIKRRTGISIQQIKKNERGKGNNNIFVKHICEYQVQYIKKKYDIGHIRQVLKKYLLMEKKVSFNAKKKNMILLGCCFGNYVFVFRELLGKQNYDTLHKECLSEKLSFILKERLSNGKSPMLLPEIQEKRYQTMIKKYGTKHPNQNKEIKEKMISKMKKTMNEKYGVDYAAQVPEVAKKICKSRQQTMLKKYGVKDSVLSKDIRNKIFDKRRQNGTLNTSLPEETMYFELVSIFGRENVIRNIIVDNRYPYHVDFYILSRDMFIELNGDKCHGDHWFDINNEDDIQKLYDWRVNSEKLISQGKNNNRYLRYIDTWTVKDVLKRDIACKNNLNYLVFWDAGVKYKNKKRTATLFDFYDWVDKGCPDSFCYKKENTY